MSNDKPTQPAEQNEKPEYTADPYLRVMLSIDLRQDRQWKLEAVLQQAA